MAHAKLSRVAGVGLTALLLAACGEPDLEALRAVAKKHNLNKAEGKAFFACTTHSDGTTPLLLDKPDKRRLKEVTMDLCACQAKGMVAVFKDEHYESYGKVAKWLNKSNRKNEPAIRLKDLRKGIKPKKAGADLASSLEQCVQQLEATDQQAAAAIIEVIKPKRKKVKGAKDAKDDKKDKKVEQTDG